MLSRHRVLVIDDEAGIRQALADVLTYEGYDVRSAHDGREGLAVLADWKPDVVLLDLIMPVMDGRSFRKAQSSLPDLLRSIPVVIISGAIHSDGEAQALGAFSFLTKPFDLDDVLEIVKQAVNSPNEGGRAAQPNASKVEHLS